MRVNIYVEMLPNRLISGMNGYEIFRIPFSVVPTCDSALHAPTTAGVFVHICDNDMVFSSNLNTGKAERKIAQFHGNAFILLRKYRCRV